MFKTVGWPEMILFLVVIILVFGVGRISKIAGELGSGIRAFREGLSEKNEKSSEFIEDDSEDNSED